MNSETLAQKHKKPEIDAVMIAVLELAMGRLNKWTTMDAGSPFSASDLPENIAGKYDRNLIGIGFRNLALKGIIAFVDYHISDHASRKGGVERIWRLRNPNAATQLLHKLQAAQASYPVKPEQMMLAQ